MPSKKTDDDSWVDKLMEEGDADAAVWGESPKASLPRHNPHSPRDDPFAREPPWPGPTARRLGTVEDLQHNQAWRAELIAAGHVPQDYLGLVATPAGWVKVDKERRAAHKAFTEASKDWAERRRLAYRELQDQGYHGASQDTMKLRRAWFRDNPPPNYVEPYNTWTDPPADIGRIELVTNGYCEHACAACAHAVMEIQDDDVNLGIFDSPDAMNQRMVELEDRLTLLTGELVAAQRRVPWTFVVLAIVGMIIVFLATWLR